MYPGASADAVMKSVVIPLEEQINGVEDMTYMTSTSNNDGSASINIYFKFTHKHTLFYYNLLIIYKYHTIFFQNSPYF